MTYHCQECGKHEDACFCVGSRYILRTEPAPIVLGDTIGSNPAPRHPPITQARITPILDALITAHCVTNDAMPSNIYLGEHEYALLKVVMGHSLRWGAGDRYYQIPIQRVNSTQHIAVA